VVEIRSSPGAAGTVTNNLSALGVGEIIAIGAIGDDGQGYELLRGLHRTRVDTTHLLQSERLFTPTYIKTMVRTAVGEQELERIDIKNRLPMPLEMEDRFIATLTSLVEGRQPSMNAVILADQVPERNCGVLTDRCRQAIAELAGRNPRVLFFADSRVRIGEFRGVIIKPNKFEAARALNPGWTGDISRAQAVAMGRALALRNGRPVFLTLGEEGMLVCEGESCEHVPAPPVRGPIDIVGAGDSATAGIVCALCVGASLKEAAFLGNLCASVTIHKLGTTGTASPEELQAAL
jgi:rfaE bifunctional protein kinase chain/domain